MITTQQPTGNPSSEEGELDVEGFGVVEDVVFVGDEDFVGDEE